MRISLQVVCAMMCTLIAVTSWSLLEQTEAAVVTTRLGTGLPPTGSAGVLPQTWVAPADAAPRIDGKLDETIWDAAQPMVLGKLVTRGKTSPRTEARLVHKDKVLYVGVKVDEPHMDRLKRAVTDNDGAVYGDDSIELFISPHPPRGYFQFIVNAAGAVFDRHGHGDPKAFDAGVKTAIQLGTSGWTLEAAIPMAPMGVGDELPAHWRANIYRNRQAGTEGNVQAWSATLSEHFDRPDYFGHWLFTPQLPWEKSESAEGEPLGITVKEVDRGEGVLEFDLSSIPSGTKVYRARLLCTRRQLDAGDENALAAIEILPLSAAFEENTAPRTSGTPLKLAQPLYRSFDMTNLVQDWVAGRGTPAVLVKTFPGWQPEKTLLDVTYEGQPQDVPAQVSGVTVFHREGQTFITFREVDPLITKADTTWGEIKSARANNPDACSYRIYRHSAPINAQTITRAELVAEVKPLSGYNTDGRNKEYLIGQAMIHPDEMGELARDWNGYMHTWIMSSPRMDRYPVPRFVIAERRGPLPVGTGLYVHQVDRPERSYYTVVSCRRGVENLSDLSGRNTTGAIDEKVGPGVPVRQGKGLWGPFFDYPGTRWVYVQWAGPPLAPRQNMYFNWSVLIPPSISGKAPTELYFHPSGYSYAQPGKKAMRDSIQLAPHDHPASGWYGFNDAWGTLKNLTDGVVSNHTQRRIIAFLDWAKQTLPVDPDRVVCTGADGAAALALSYPDKFAFVRTTGFDSAVLDPEAAGRYEAIWGPKSPHIKDDHGCANWEWADLDKLVAAQQNDLPLFTCLGYSWGRHGGYAKGRGRFYDAMLQARQPLVACWGWDGARNLQPIDRFTGNWRGLLIRRTDAVPAFSNCSNDQDKEQTGRAGGEYHWQDVRDTPDEFSVTITAHQDSTFDLTPRRLQHFEIRPNEKFDWDAVMVPGRGGETTADQSGTVTADADGQVTIRGLKYPDHSDRLTITIRRAK